MEYGMKLFLSRACCVLQLLETEMRELSYFSQSLKEIGSTLGVYKAVTCRKATRRLELH